MSDSLQQFGKDLDEINWTELLLSGDDEVFDTKWASFLKRATNLGYPAVDMINKKRGQINDALFQEA